MIALSIRVLAYHIIDIIDIQIFSVSTNMTKAKLLIRVNPPFSVEDDGIVVLNIIFFIVIFVQPDYTIFIQMISYHWKLHIWWWKKSN